MAKAKSGRRHRHKNAGVRFAGHFEVVGGFYHQMWDAKMDGKLQEGSWLMMRREPKNMHDGNAIEIFTQDGKQKLGYVSKDDALRLAPFMDIGVKMAGRVLTLIHNPMRATARLYIKK